MKKGTGDAQSGFLAAIEKPFQERRQGGCLAPLNIKGSGRDTEGGG